MPVSSHKDESLGLWVIENECLRLTASAERGGIVSLFDKRTEKECLTDQGGRFWGCEESEQPCLVALREEDDQASLVLSSTEWTKRCTWHAWITLASGVAAAKARVTVWNRDWSPVTCSPHICLWRRESLVVAPTRYEAAAFIEGDATGVVGTAFGEREWQLAPQASAHVEARVFAVPGLGRVDYSSSDAAVQVEGSKLSVAVHEERPGHLVLIGSEGRTLESRADLTPSAPTSIALPELPGGVEVVQIRDNHGRVILDSRSQASATRTAREPIESIAEMLHSDKELRGAERLADVGAAATLALGLNAMARHEWEAAVDLLEDAALLRSDCPLLWWAKAYCIRRLDGDPAQVLANAHYLAPLDPLLRADSYLSAREDAKPDALLDAWGANPQPYLEAAQALVDAGLTEERVRWLEEARRRAPCSLVERLLAAAHAEQGRDLAVSEHLRFAADSPAVADPFRRSELAAMAKLGLG